jgi:flagellar biosynthetic protein FliR
MEIMEFAVKHFQVFLLVWVRLSATILMAPMFSSPLVPDRMKLVFSFALTLTVFPWVAKYTPPIPVDMLMFGLVVLKEAIIGIIIGFFEAMIFAAFTLGTQFFSVQMGLGMSQVFDPITQEETPILSSMFYLIALLVFVGMGGMHMIIRAAVDSFQMIPAIDLILNREALLDTVVRYFSMMFLIALKLAFPIMATGTVLAIALGLLGKASPQLNIMSFGLPIQFGVGLLVLMLVLPAMIQMFGTLFENGVNDIMFTLKALKLKA